MTKIKEKKVKRRNLPWILKGQIDFKSRGNI